MKKVYGVLALAALFLTSCGSGVGVSDPEDVGPQVMDILEEMDDMELEDFDECFMSLEDIRELGENDEVITEQRSRNLLTKMTKDDRSKDIKRSFERLKEKGEDYKITWSDIELDDFVYELETEGGMKICGGELIFKSGNDKYKVRTTSIFDGSDYNLVEIRGPYKED